MRFNWNDLVTMNPGYHIARHTHRPGSRVALHDHDFAEVCWIEKGSLIHQTDRGREELHSGDGLLVSPHHRHGFGGSKSTATMVNIAIPAPTWQRWQSSYGEMTDWAWYDSDTPIKFSMPARRHVSIDSLINEPSDQLAIDVFFLNLLHLIRPRPTLNIAATAPAWLHDAIALCHEPPYLIDGIAAITTASGRSREHCTRSIRKYCGCTAQELVRRLRLEWLAKQLRLSNTPFNLLCTHIGAVNVTHLHKHFTALFGCTPGEYRRQAKRIA